MKLWLKISLGNIAVLLTVVLVCGTILIMESKNNMLYHTTQQLLSEQRNLEISFESMARRYLEAEKDITALTKRSVVEYCFRQFVSQNPLTSSVLVGKGEQADERSEAVPFKKDIIHPDRVRGIQPELLLPISADSPNALAYNEHDTRQEMLLKKIDGRHNLIVGSRVYLSGDVYVVYVVKDISELYNALSATILRFIIICGIGVAVGTSLIIFLVRKGWGTLQVEEHISALESTTKRQQLLIGGITHEFKTPMTSMMLHSDTLLSTALDTDAAQRSLVHIHEQCRWLEGLTQKLLRLIMLDEAAQVKPERVSQLFNDISKSVSLDETSLQIDCRIDTLDIDYDLMKSLLINLINNSANALKASGKQGLIVLSAHDGGFEVRDNGNGIPHEEVERIFEPFYMVDRSRNKAAGGCGLGLALVKQIADAHGAVLVVDSEVGKGTSVKVMLKKT